MPELPSGKRRRYADMGLPRADVLLLTDDVATAAYFEDAVEAGAPPKAAANWILGDIGAHCNVRSLGHLEHAGRRPSCAHAAAAAVKLRTSVAVATALAVWTVRNIQGRGA